jgi:outer membrane protein TolC
MPTLFTYFNHSHTLLLLICVASISNLGAEDANVYPPVLPQPQASEQHWLLPLLSSAKTAAEQQPNVVRATRELRRSELARYQVMARWNPELTLGGDLSENRRISTSSVDGFGVVVDQGAGANAALSNTFSTGTTVRVQAATQQSQNSSASALRPEFWNSTVQLVMSQALLQGANYHVNRTELYNARDQYDSDRDTRDELLENQLLSLAELWLDKAQSEIELELRQQHLTLVQKYLRFAEERARLGLGRELDAFSLRRDLAADEAQIGVSQRALSALQETLKVTWPNYSLPETKPLRSVLLPAAIAEKDFTTTRSGRTNLRRIEISSRQVALAKWNAFDRLDLTGSIGKNGTDVTLDGSWSELSNPDTYRWTVGLNYVHRFGSDNERLEYQRALIALDQSTLQGTSDERAWRSQALMLRQTLSDAQSRVGEIQRVYQAYREEYRLTKAQADAGLIAMRDLISIDNQLNTVFTQVIQAHLTTLRAEVRLRAHEDRLLELFVP